MPHLLQHRHEGAADVAVVPGYEYLTPIVPLSQGSLPDLPTWVAALPEALQPLLVPKRVTRSKGKAIFAVAHTMIVVVWHIALQRRGHLPRPRPERVSSQSSGCARAVVLGTGLSTDASKIARQEIVGGQPQPAGCFDLR